jgi:hypothetical protein
MDIFKTLESEIRKKIIGDDRNEIDNIEKILESIYDTIYEEKSADNVRLNLQSLSEAFHNVGDNSVAILLFVLLKKLSNLDGIKINKNVKIKQFNDLEVIFTFLENDLKKNININFLDHKKADPGIGNDKLYAGLINVFHCFLNEHKVEVDSLALPLLTLINLWEISSKKDRVYEFFILFNSLLHKISFHGHNQTVRDLAELSLVLGHRNKKLQYSFYVKMSSFARQINMIDSLLSAHLMLHGYNYTHAEIDTFLSKALLELFITLRNLHLYPYTKSVYEAHEKLKIDDKYDNHQFDMAYFNMLLIMGDDDIFAQTDKYLGENDALLFGAQSGAPWIVLLLNLKLNNPQLFDSKRNLVTTLELLNNDTRISENSVVKNFKLAVSDRTEDNKKAVLDKVKHIQKSVNYTDVSYELTSIYPLVYNLLTNSVREKNYEGILIAHTLSSDSSSIIISDRKADLGMYKMEDIVDDNGNSVFDNYINHINPLVIESDNVTFLWLGCTSQFTYCLKLYKNNFHLTINKDFSLDYLSQWEKENIEKLAFNDQPSNGSHLVPYEEIWGQDSDDFIKNQLPTLTDKIDSSEVVIFRDAKIARFPISLLKDKNGDLLVNYTCVSISTSVYSYTSYKKTSVDAKILKLWAPIEEGDIPINIAHGKIFDAFSHDELISVESLNPRNDLNKDINIFISHGDKDEFYGFKSISPAENLYFIEDEDIFGHGKIAILFICHSGSSRSSLYATKINTLVSKLHKMGYEAVLAPAWSYNVMLAGIWTKAFINAFREGNSLSKSNFIANTEVKNRFIGVGAYAAMHLFGNNLLHSHGYDN